MTDYVAMTRTIHQQGLDDRATEPFDGPGAGVPLRIDYFTPTGEATMIVAPEGLSPGLRPRLKALSILLRAIECPAAIFQSDVRQVEMYKFLDYFRLGRPEPKVGMEIYSRVLSEQFGGEVKNMPRSLWYDAIVTSLRGPKLPSFGMSTRYHGGADNACVFEPTKEAGTFVVNVLPEWWDTTVQ